MEDSSYQPARPDNESARLQCLRDFDIIGSSREYAFDNLATIASKIVEMPIALIGLMAENTEWYKSAIGVDWYELDREKSLGDLVISSGESVLIADTQTDPRCEGNALVEDEHPIRTYAGLPLTTSDGIVIGVLSVLGKEPHSYTRTEENILQRLATEVISQIELRYQNEERRKTNARLREELEETSEKLHEKTLEHDELLHRTKNNFTRIKSLLSLQKEKIKDESNYQALELAETRLHTFICIHDQLNEARQSESLSSREYLGSIIRNIASLFEGEENLPETSIDIQDIRLSNYAALKFGLALNELITNAYQHVFLKGNGSALTIQFRGENGKFRLEISDDGPGLSEREDSNQSYDSGLKLIEDLIEYGKSGSFEYNFNGGAHFTICLPQESTVKQ